MIALVTGGASSGKSAFAESLALALPGPHAYLATMRYGDDETRARIERHRRARSGSGFSTIELAYERELGVRAATALLEDLGNLVANGLEGHLETVLAWDNVVVVGNEVGCDAGPYDELTNGYRAQLGKLSCEIAARADVVVEVVAGVPLVAKGELPWMC